MTTETVSVSLRCIDFFRDFLTRLVGGDENQGDPTSLIQELNEHRRRGRRRTNT